MNNQNQIEAFNLTAQMAAEQVQSLTFFVLANVAAYDPATNKIKAVIPNWTNDGQNVMETGWIPLSTMWNGQNYGMQVGPYGGGTISDPTGQKSGALPEQVMILVVNRENTMYMAGAFFFNTTLTPPGNAQDIIDTYGNITRSQFQSGECLIRHSSGSYIFMAQDGSITAVAATSPQPPFKESDDSSLERNLYLGTTVNADSQVTNPTTLNTTVNLTGIVGVQDGSIPDAATANSTVSINAEITGGQTDTAITSLAATVNPKTGGTGTSAVNIDAAGAADTSNGTISLLSNMSGDTTVNNTINAEANSTGGGTNTSAMSLSAIAGGSSPNASIDMTATADNNATISITADGSVTVTAPLVNIVSPEINCGTGSMKRVLNDVFAQFFNNHVHSGVQAGSSDSGKPTVDADSTHESQNLYSS